LYFTLSEIISEYGGEAGPIENIINSWEKKIMSYREYFQQESQFGVDESVKSGSRKYQTTTHERVTGENFRQLEFD
jgi:hypothetical protein